MHPHLKSLLVKAGCAADATDDDAQKFYDQMSGDKKADVDGKLAKLMDGGDEDLSAGTSARPEPPLPGNAVSVPAALSAKQITAIGLAVSAALVAALGGTAATPAAVAQLGARPNGPAVDDDEVAVKAEELRVGRIRRLGQLHKVPEAVTNTVIAENGRFEDARLAILRHVHATAKPIAAISVGEDKNIASLRAAIPQAIVLRAGLSAATFERLGEKVHERANELRQLPVLDMFRQYIASMGFAEVHSFSRTKVASLLGPRTLRATFPRIAALAESTSDFGNITLDAINKTLRFNYLDAKRTWPIWAEKKFNPDFKNINRVVLSEAPNMVSANEGGEMQYVQLSDSKETYLLTTYKAGIRLTRNAIINDDLDAFSSIPRLQANSAARKEDDVAYAVVTGNANMADGNAIFSTAHLNLVGSGSGGIPSVAQMQTTATLMKKQKGLAGVARLELDPKFLLVPTSIEEQTKEFIGSKTLIASQSSSGSAPLSIGDSNPFFNRYQVIGSTRLDDASTHQWYLFADWRDGQVNTVEVCFLTDEPEPVIRQETDFDSEDVKYLVRHTVAAKAIDYRGLAANFGS